MERDTRRRREEPDRYPPRRRKNKRSPVSSSMMYIVLVCAVSVVLAAVCWSLGNDVLALNKESTSATITVNDENDFGSVADQLKGNDIIKHKGLFKLFASLTGGKDKIAQGTYEVNSDMDYRALLNSMSSNSASRKDISVTITEGQTLKQIFELLEKEGVSTVEKLEDMAANHDYAFSFLQDIPLGDPTRLEGYLFPDTYEIHSEVTPEAIMKMMAEDFATRLTPELRQQAAAKNLSIHDLVTLASLVEKEARYDEDRPIIAQVFFKRLQMGMPLQSDTTLQYLMAGPKEDVSIEDTKIDSPYNTYQHMGLPPGPICNPGMKSIEAALNPEQTGYYYFALDMETKSMRFFTTLAEHEAFVATQDYG